MTAWDARTHQVRATGPRRPDHRPGWHLRPRQPARTGHTGARPHSRQPGWIDMRVIIADDSLPLRGGLARLLADSDAGVDVVATAENATMLAREGDRSDPDAVIVDIRMPPTHTDEDSPQPGPCTPNATSRHPCPVAIPRVALCAHPAQRRARTRRLPAQGPGLTHRRPRRRTYQVVAGECVIDPTI